MAVRYEVPFGSQCPKHLYLKKTTKKVCKECPYNIGTYHTFACCSDVNRLEEKKV